MRKLNKPLLRRLAQRLRRLKHEEHYDQAHYINATKCGTAACMAGHLQIMVAHRIESPSWSAGWQKHADALGLTMWQANRLFMFVGTRASGPEYNWPEPYLSRYLYAKDAWSKERPSTVAADLLEAIADGTVKL